MQNDGGSNDVTITDSPDDVGDLVAEYQPISIRQLPEFEIEARELFEAGGRRGSVLVEVTGQPVGGTMNRIWPEWSPPNAFTHSAPPFIVTNSGRDLFRLFVSPNYSGASARVRVCSQQQCTDSIEIDLWARTEGALYSVE